MNQIGRSLLLVLIAAALGGSPCGADEGDAPLTEEEFQAIAKEAYVYGYPLIENYKVLHAYALDPMSRSFKAPVNQLHNEARVYTPDDSAVVTPNSDTPYSFLVMDLRAEPMVLTIPKMEDNRYFSIQLIDLYTHNFAYLGTRATGNGGGTWIVAGPNWRQEAPEGVDGVLECETQLAFAVYRTQLFSPADLPNVEKLQALYEVRPLSTFLGTTPPPAGEATWWPSLQADMAESPALFGYLNFLLQFAPTHPSEEKLMERFSRIGVGAGLPWDARALDPDTKRMCQLGIADAWKDYEALQQRIAAGEVESGDVFGTREFLENDYLRRMAGAKIGLYGNSQEEAVYPLYAVDESGEPLDASKRAYVLHFAKGQEPPAEAFWSVTLYDGMTQLLVKNPLDRYLINSPMLDQLKRDADGGLTLYVQHASPGPEKESNWLPAPNGPFYLVLRMYLPKPEVLDGTWSAPPLERTR